MVLFGYLWSEVVDTGGEFTYKAPIPAKTRRRR